MVSKWISDSRGSTPPPETAVDIIVGLMNSAGNKV